MRIRKNAKISPLLYPTSSLLPQTVLQTHVCQLNQSPWDVMNFSSPSALPLPSPPQLKVNKNDYPEMNGSSRDFISVVESEKIDDDLDGGNATADNAPNKQVAAVKVAAKSRSTRPKKASTSSNPNEFYYYSGFRPSWGKKRGQVNADNLEQKQEIESSRIADQFVEDDFECSENEDKDNKENGKKRPRKRIKTRSLKSLM